MSITAIVEKDIIRLPAEAHFPDGAEVRVELLKTRPAKMPLASWIQDSVGVADAGLSTDEIMKMTRGEE